MSDNHRQAEGIAPLTTELWRRPLNDLFGKHRRAASARVDRPLLVSTTQMAQERSDTSKPAKYSIIHLPCSQSDYDLTGARPLNRAVQLRMLRAEISTVLP